MSRNNQRFTCNTFWSSAQPPPLHCNNCSFPSHVFRNIPLGPWQGKDKRSDWNEAKASKQLKLAAQAAVC